MLTFLLVVHAIITAILVGVILMQRSEGGGLGMGGSPTGLMSARGAADFLTRATTVLASLFVALSIASAVVASRSSGPVTIDTSLKRTTAPVPAPAPAPSVPLNGDAAGNSAGSVAPLPTPNPAVPAPPALTPAAAVPRRSKVQTTTPISDVVTDRAGPTSPKQDRPAVTPTVTPSIPRPVAPVTTMPVGPSGNGN